jgi:DNA-binding transcriptional MerR regulator/methylmalonyl-CoA mutase cobalamin-binding subunit
MPDAQFPIQMVARLTGLSTHVIRIWEQRYRAVEPQRTPGNHRVYSQEDIERLKLLRDLTHAGHNIGQIAQLSTEKLGKLVGASPSLQAAVASEGRERGPQDKDAYLDECLMAIKSLDIQALDAVLKRGAVALGTMGVLQGVVAPLAQRIGDLWRDGTLTAAHEHFASAGIRVFLGYTSRPYGPMDGAPILAVATPAGQVHELGALLVGATASNLGWQVTYLGSSLPAAEIAGAVRQSRAKALALSLVYPEDDPTLKVELRHLGESLPASVVVIAGGRAAQAYGEVLESIGAVLVEDLGQLGAILDGLRKTRREVKS